MMYKMTLLSIPMLALSGLAFAAESGPVAEVYGEKVSAAELAIPPKMLAEKGESLSAEELAIRQQDGQRQLLAYAVMEEARKRFLTEMKLTPTDAEIDGYIEAQQRRMAADAVKRQQEQQQLLQELKQPGLTDERRLYIENDLKANDELAELLKSTIPPAGEASAQDQAQQRRVANMMVSSWKFNQGLYHKYGGRVVFQQAGLEPLAANKVFLDQLKASGDYTIIDPAYQNLFKESYAYFEQEFQTVDKAKADEYFASPWWLKADNAAE